MARIPSWGKYTTLTLAAYAGSSVAPISSATVHWQMDPQTSPQCNKHKQAVQVNTNQNSVYSIVYVFTVIEFFVDMWAYAHPSGN